MDGSSNKITLTRQEIRESVLRRHVYFQINCSFLVFHPEQYIHFYYTVDNLKEAVSSWNILKSFLLICDLIERSQEIFHQIP